MIRLAFVASVLLPLTLPGPLRAGGGAADEERSYVAPNDPLVAEKLRAWQGLKFGLLMHWGPNSQWGIVESWSICGEDVPWTRRKSDDYVEYKRQYESLKATFDPLEFDPARWARAARDAGMRYVVFTTKHHDGFCMFDTKLTDYRITDPGCPFSDHPRADVTKAIFDAFRAEGLWTGAYFSKPDWHSEDYWWPYFPTPDRNVNYEIDRYPERWERFIQLAGIGDWMRVNADAIYGSTTRAPYKQGDVCVLNGADGAVHAIVLAGERDDRPPSKILVPSVRTAPHAEVRMLGNERLLPWVQSGDDVEVTIPKSLREDPPCRHAWVLRITATE